MNSEEIDLYNFHYVFIVVERMFGGFSDIISAYNCEKKAKEHAKRLCEEVKDSTAFRHICMEVE